MHVKKIMKLIGVILLTATFVCGQFVEKTVYSRSTFTATAYCLKGRTASGQRVRDGLIAADPRVLPIGTQVSIEGLGRFLVADTGGAIKGTRIDIWMGSCQRAISWGRRKVVIKKL
jgi:3D (Asp-Asp-Asp) domain-containing protein